MRGPERLLVPLPGGGPVEPYTGARAVKALRFEGRSKEVGPAALPAPLRQVLSDRGLGRAVLSLLPAPTVRTGGPLGARQSVWGWWVAEDHAATFDAERPLRRVEGTRFAPEGPFHVELDRYDLADLSRRRLRCEAMRSGEGGDGVEPLRVVATDDPLDVLPPELADVVRGGQVVAMRSEGGRRPQEEIYGLIVAQIGPMGAVWAERSARIGAEASEKALARARWRAVVLEARVTGASTETITVDPEPKGRRGALGRGRHAKSDSTGPELPRPGG